MRSSTQSTAVIPASLAWSSGPGLRFVAPGCGGRGLSVGERGLRELELGHGLRALELALRGPRRVQVLADAVEVLARVAGREALELGVDAEARADLDRAVAHARVEAVERADRRAAVTSPRKS